MSEKYYTKERGQLMLVSLLKQHGIRRVVASPGTTNVTFVASLMADPFFEIYSAPDERSGAYMACGMAAESGEPVVITCTGATASRNYLPAMTEAYYRKLPILAVTAHQGAIRVGHLQPQVIDRGTQLNDTYVLSEYVGVPQNDDEAWDANIRLNRAILALRHRGGGPVHINLATNYTSDFSQRTLPEAAMIRRYTLSDAISGLLPALPQGRIGIRVGNHKVWSPALVEAVDAFCTRYGAVVFCEHGSNYPGRFRVYNSLVGVQPSGRESFKTELLVHIGEVGSYGNDATSDTRRVWRVSEDGELRDLMRRLTDVFEMSELDFFMLYAQKAEREGIDRSKQGAAWLDDCHQAYKRVASMLPKDLPFSNIWIAQQTANRLPDNSVLHVGILHSQRSWSFFDPPESVRGMCFVNTGGFGIDGCMSSAIGGALALPDKLHFLVIGDLAFFYDLNSLGNRHVGANLRILLINNGKGTEFRNYGHFAYPFGEAADPFIAAAGHYGNKSDRLVKHYAEDLGFKYISASNKDEYLRALPEFLSTEPTGQSIVFEVFTTDADESDALKAVFTLLPPEKSTSQVIKDTIKSVIGPKANDILKTLKNL